MFAQDFPVVSGLPRWPLLSDPANLTRSSDSLPSFVSPVGLLWNDLKLFFKIWKTIPGIILPLHPARSGELDELSLTLGNIGDLIFHAILIVCQLGFLLLIPLSIFLPFNIFLTFFIGFLVVNYFVCLPFNGKEGAIYRARPKNGIPIAGRGEKWIFINGVSVEHRWLQNNLQLLANTFRREIVGVHNPTSGIIFDLIQCLIERDFQYNTRDVRQAYAMVKDELTRTTNPNDKVILIVHSQGGIEGGMVIDWLLADVSEDNMSKLEVYTFGNAANHFNNPIRSGSTDKTNPETYRAIRHIEHYANHGDFVARFGVLNYAKKAPGQKENRFVGRVFERQGSGHMFCQHYLDTMFTMDGDKVAEGNPFMDSPLEVDMDNTETIFAQKAHKRTIKSMSRLWEYRNGGKPST
ncbi:hypothetical protein CISG_08988 [Coccidioides immitis RMSCC 3703]|uniref:DUF676 domain-containing protein n=1 Tax=Coccidioides immitis RMSCC 3703 TaxID=454286 RepID=A0A0J8RBQ8_COCIT|nr:hypothetical protein CISG_08988 [Coccidioides immitis RMSCC 3703]